MTQCGWGPVSSGSREPGKKHGRVFSKSMKKVFRQVKRDTHPASARRALIDPARRALLPATFRSHRASSHLHTSHTEAGDLCARHTFRHTAPKLHIRPLLSHARTRHPSTCMPEHACAESRKLTLAPFSPGPNRCRRRPGKSGWQEVHLGFLPSSLLARASRPRSFRPCSSEYSTAPPARFATSPRPMRPPAA